jgi:hypothetical protein
MNVWRQAAKPRVWRQAGVGAGPQQGGSTLAATAARPAALPRGHTKTSVLDSFSNSQPGLPSGKLCKDGDVDLNEGDGDATLQISIEVDHQPEVKP